MDFGHVPDGGPLRLASVVAALSLATDLGTGRPMEHALRTAVVATRLGEAAGLPATQLSDAYYVSLLRMVGCTADAHLAAMLFGDELAAGRWFATADTGSAVEMLGRTLRHVGGGAPLLARLRRVGTAVVGLPQLATLPAGHCEVAQRLSERLGLPPSTRRALGQVFERWDGKGPKGLAAEAVDPAVRVVAVAEAADALRTAWAPEADDAVTRVLEARAGGAYDPNVVARYRSHAERLFDGLGVGADWDLALECEPGGRPHLGQREMDAAAEAMADFADMKSPWTLGHSRRVAMLAEGAGRRLTLGPAELHALRRAALVHDLGRAGITSAIWGNVGALSAGEWERVRLHPYYTERILARPSALAEIGRLASLHHEREDGSGYHRGTVGAAGGAGALLAAPLVSGRVLAAADAFAAMTENRPHRPAHTPQRAAELLAEETRSGRLDVQAANAVLDAAGHRENQVASRNAHFQRD